MAFLKKSSVDFVCGLLIILLFLQCANRVSSASGFVQTRGSQFMLNGSKFIFNGFNSYWMMHLAAEPADRYKITNVFREASGAGLTVCRTWAFSDGGDRALQISPGVYDERVFQALDFVVSEAKKHGVLLILTLSNNYNDFGGKAQYANWARNAGVQVHNEDEFYTNNVIKGYYRNHIQRVLTRINTITGVAYKDDPIIMGWELMNEPRNQVDYSGKTINVWVQEMAHFLKSIDRNHLLAVGMEGFYGDSLPDRKQYNPGYEVGTDFITNNLVNDIDFSTIHVYPDIWLKGQNDGAQIAFMRRWLISHLTDSKNILKKPMIFSEFGKSSKDPGYSMNARDTYLDAVYSNIYSLARGGGIGGGLVWQILAEGMGSFSDGYEIVLSQEPSTSRIITQQSQQMTSLENMMNIRQRAQMNNKHGIP